LLKILKYIVSTVDINNPQDFWNPISVLEFVKATPLFQNWLKNHNLQIKSVAVTVGHSDSMCGPHLDTPPARFKLSWPVQNTATTFNRFFQHKINPCSIKINHWGGTQYLNIDDLEEIDRMQVDVPAIIDAQIPHDVWCEPGSKFPRLGLQCQLLKEPAEL
jgi:hypothetical protein